MNIYPNNTKILIRKDMWIPLFIIALFIITKIWKQPKYIYTHTHTHTHIYIYMCVLYALYIHIYIYIYVNISLKKEWNLAICDNIHGPRGYMDLEDTWNVRWKKINTVWFYLYVDSKKQNKWTNIEKRNIITGTENKQMVARGAVSGGGKK